jgi:tetratricopeptide (TPR) repeat protein
VTYMMSLLPRWGGSYEEMDRFAEESRRASSNPKMRLLAGYADRDRCNLALRQPDLDRAFAACDAATSVGEHWDFLFERAGVLASLDRRPEALVDLDRAVTLRPQDRHLLRRRARLLKQMRAYRRFAADFAVLREIDPVEGPNNGDAAWAARGLAYEASRQTKSGQTNKAIALLQRAVAMQPDDQLAHLRLDAALSSAGRLDEVVVMWTRYLARHPDDRRGYLERAGAHHHLGHEPLALRDLREACRLQEAQACTILQRRAVPP